MSTFWEKIKQLLKIEESCVYHDFLIIEKKDVGYSIVRYDYILKCSVCREIKEMSARELNESIESNSPEFINLEIYREGTTRKSRNKKHLLD